MNCKKRKRVTCPKRRISKVGSITPHLRKSFSTLQQISKVKSRSERRRQLNEASKNPSFCIGLREIAVNCLAGNLKVSEKNKRKLQRSKKLIRELASTKNRSRQKKLVVQSGGILPFLIPAAAAALAPTLGGLLKNVLF